MQEDHDDGDRFLYICFQYASSVTTTSSHHFARGQVGSYSLNEALETSRPKETSGNANRNYRAREICGECEGVSVSQTIEAKHRGPWIGGHLNFKHSI